LHWISRCFWFVNIQLSGTRLVNISVNACHWLVTSLNACHWLVDGRHWAWLYQINLRPLNMEGWGNPSATRTFFPIPDERPQLQSAFWTVELKMLLTNLSTKTSREITSIVNSCEILCGLVFYTSYTCSDNFSFQNNGIKKCTCWKTMGFLGTQWVLGNNVFFKKQCFWHDFTHDLFWL